MVGKIAVSQSRLDRHYPSIIIITTTIIISTITSTTAIITMTV